MSPLNPLRGERVSLHPLTTGRLDMKDQQRMERLFLSHSGREAEHPPSPWTVKYHREVIQPFIYLNIHTLMVSSEDTRTVYKAVKSMSTTKMKDKDLKDD